MLDAVQSSNAPSVIWWEKPIASSVTQAIEMVQAFEDTGVGLVNNYPRRFANDFQVLRDHIREGDLLGDIQSVTLQFKQELLRNGAHMIDLLVFLLDEHVSELSGVLTNDKELSSSVATINNTDDTGGGALLTMTNGTFVTVDCTVSREFWSGYLRILGTKGKLSIDQGDERQYWSFDGTDHVKTTISGTFNGEKTPDLDKTFTTAARHVVNLLDGTVDNRSPGREATHVTEILTAIFVSGYTMDTSPYP